MAKRSRDVPSGRVVQLGLELSALAGTPSLKIHDPMSADTTELACMSSIPMASGQLAY